jgi:HAD superfamily hydrolase (TIGR01509 family)
MIRAVIFDMGGTLLRYVRPGNGAWREFEERGIRGLYRYLVAQGHPMPAGEEAFVAHMFQRLVQGWEQATGGHINLRAVDWIAVGAADHNLTLTESALIEAVHHYARPLRDGVSAMPGAAVALAELRARGLHIGLISNTIWPGDLHRDDLMALGLWSSIEYAVFSGDLGIWKPRPQIFLHVLEHFGVSPAEAIFVGDSPKEDIRGAQQAGMRAFWVRSPEFPLPPDIYPDAIIENPGEVVPLLEASGQLPPRSSVSRKG